MCCQSTLGIAGLWILHRHTKSFLFDFRPSSFWFLFPFIDPYFWKGSAFDDHLEHVHKEFYFDSLLHIKSLALAELYLKRMNESELNQMADLVNIFTDYRRNIYTSTKNDGCY